MSNEMVLKANFGERPARECDVCGQRRPLARSRLMGLETHACDECRDDAAGDIGEIAATVDELVALLDRFYKQYPDELCGRLGGLWPEMTSVNPELVRKMRDLSDDL